MINKVILIGNLGQDPSFRALEGGASVTQISIATNESYLDKNTNEWIRKTEWHEVVMWRNLAERAEKTLKKGMQIYVEGKLTHRKWQDKDGNDRYKTEVVANTFRILGRKDDPSGIGSTGFSGQSSPLSTELPTTTQGDSADTEKDDLPF